MKIAIVVVVVAYVGVLVASAPHVSGDHLGLNSFVDFAQNGKVRSATFLDQDGYIVGQYLRPDGTTSAYNVAYLSNNVTSDRLVGVLVGDNVPTQVDKQTVKGLAGPATVLLPTLLLIILFVYFIRSYTQGTGLFGVGSGARKTREDDTRVNFEDVAGQDAAVAELREVAEFLADTDRFAALGALIPRGILLYGPPGCGKTLLARALAGQAGAAFYSISGSDFVELYVGVGAARVRKLFEEARENAPAIIFIDELDAVGRRRAASGPASSGSTEEQGQALNQLLAEIDGFAPREGVMLVGATNRPDVIDPALLRPGRFDRAVGLELPDEHGRREILAVHARSKPMSPGVDLDRIAHDAIGMTGADLAGLMNEAALLAARRHSSSIATEDLEHAMRRIREAPERQRRLAVRDRRIGQSALDGERITFADVAGLDDAVAELGEVREHLADPARFERLGARIPTGYLLTGLPGSGKTLLARALAGETNATFVTAAASEFVEVFVGEGAARVRDLFAQARSVAPAIVFIDEIDAIGGKRGATSVDSGERANTLNQLLIELDGFSGRTGVVVMAATNRPDILDSALTRPGRFDRTIALDLPDLAARRAILELHASGKPLSANVDLDGLARVTRGLSGADLSNLLNEAALIAARKNKVEIDQELLEDALDRTGVGIAGTRALSDDDRKTIAYHEAGHGLVALSLPGGRVLHKISIVPRGLVLGVTWLPDADDQLLHRRSLLVERMATLLGGRVAEVLVFGEPSDGAGNDLGRVAEIARRMVTASGMSRTLGALAYPSENGGAPYSPETARLIDSEARHLVDEAERLATEVLGRQRSELDRVAEALLERETLSLAEVEAIIGTAHVLD
ncbi:MAG: AAA family ATPase [Actinomycetota bacterium]|nr:AAA family ATPase [Actinomycetota bacterium]